MWLPSWCIFLSRLLQLWASFSASWASTTWWWGMSSTTWGLAVKESKSNRITFGDDTRLLRAQSECLQLIVVVRAHRSQFQSRQDFAKSAQSHASQLASTDKVDFSYQEGHRLIWKWGWICRYASALSNHHKYLVLDDTEGGKKRIHGGRFGRVRWQEGARGRESSRRWIEVAQVTGGL